MKNVDRHINILGTGYHIEYKTMTEDSNLKEADGYCDYTSKHIVIRAKNDSKVENFEWLQRKALRHEIVHAFLAESGLQANFQHPDEFGHDETMVDWFAAQFPKISAVFDELQIAN